MRVHEPSVKTQNARDNNTIIFIMKISICEKRIYDTAEHPSAVHNTYTCIVSIYYCHCVQQT